MNTSSGSFSPSPSDMAEAGGMGTWDWNCATGTYQWSETCRRILGYHGTTVEPSHQAIMNAMHPNDRERMKQALEAAFEMDNHWEQTFRIVHPDGTVRWLTSSGRIVRDKSHQVVRMFGIMRDSTTEHHAKRAAREREAHLQSILETVPDAIIVINEHGVIESFSRAAERLFGYQASAAIGQNVNILMPSPDREAHDSYIGRYIETGTPRIIGKGRVVFGRRKDGTEFPMELQIGEARSGDRRIFTGFIHDLTESRRTEKLMQDLQAELIHVSRLSAMGTLASSIAHELNQPLTAATNYIESMVELIRQQDLATDDEGIIQEALTGALEQSLRAAGIVRRLRDFISRKEVSKQPESLHRLIEEACALALLGTSDKPVHITREVDNRVSSVMVDRIQIQQVLLNLILNAIEATESKAVRELTISAKPHGKGWAQITVADNGTGLDEEVARQLFMPFVTTKKHGMGVGLSICETIIKAHAGRIWAEPNPKGGTLFHFTLMQTEHAGMET